jgi:rifampicin phosphotransferase
VDLSGIDEGQLGGKGAGLERLVAAGASVPPFFVVTPDLLASHLARAAAEPAIHAELAALEPDASLKVLGAAAGRLQAIVTSAPIGDDLVALLAAKLPELGEGPLAVRSSMVGEDSSDRSFAGQLESFLYRRGAQQTADAVRSCWASAFGPRVLAYLLRDGALQLPRVAVVVQTMVQGEVSGVLFTAHPVTGRRDHALLTAAWGLGEGVVSGTCNTDEFVWAHTGGEVEATIVDKDIQVLPKPDEQPGTVEGPVDEAKRTIRCLDEAQVAEVCTEALRIAEAFGAPQDIEWTFAGATLWLLQSRPITALPVPENVDGPQVVFDNSNIQESYCGVTTPLTFSFAQAAYASVYEQTMRAVRLPESVITAHKPMLRNLLGLIRGRVYYNIDNWYRGLLLLPSFGRNKADMEAMMGLTDPVELVQDEVLTFGQKLGRLPGMLRTMVALLRQFGRLSRSIPAFLSDFDAAYRSMDRSRLPTATFSQLMAMIEQLRVGMLENWHVPIINDFFVMMTSGKLRRVLGQELDELYVPLMSGEEGIESTEPTRSLMRMARAAEGIDGLVDVIGAGDAADVLAAIAADFPAFQARVDDWIERYGDRCMGELKLETISLREDRSFVVQVLRSYLARPDLDPEALARRERELRDDAEGKAAAALGFFGRRKLGKALRKAREAVKNRENMRLARTRMFGLYRDVYRAIGDRLFEAGRLDAPRDVFYLATEDVLAYHEGRCVNADLAGIARARKAEFAAYEAADLPHQFTTRGPVYHGNAYRGPQRTEDVDTDARILSGIGCYPGIVEAPLRVVLGPEDDLDLTGKILCTVRTDPGWAPLFPAAAGILVERGSTLSHSAVVARELGIPAVVGVPGLLQIVRDGEPVRLDGGAGTVERLGEPEESA